MTLLLRTSRHWLLAAAIVVTIQTAVPWAAAHGPDPALSGTFGQNQELRFRWRSGSEPTAVIKTAIRAAAADANDSRASKAAVFTYDGNGSNPIGYGVGATCGVNGLACFTRDAPKGFTMWLREQGHVFDWGTLRWCQAYSSPPNGCYDAETIALDEFGHVEGLGHHVNFADDSDYADAVVQTFSRTKPSTGWNFHTFRRCDVATLQLRYDVTNASTRYSTCLDLATTLTLSAALISGSPPWTVTLTATLRVVDSDAYQRIGGNLVSGRIVSLQRRPVGGTSWTTVGPMSVMSSAGTYVSTQVQTGQVDYRAVFARPSTEGLNGTTSPTIRVAVPSYTLASRLDQVAAPRP